MKAVILAGGFGTRISEESLYRPKPLVEIGGKPILWHIMKIYSAYGINDFIICCGYKGYLIKEYFANYSLHNSDVTFNFKTGEMIVHKSSTEPWTITLADTGEATMTGGRLKRIKEYLNLNEEFCLTYGDGVSDINIGNLVEFHKNHKKLVTLTATIPEGRFGAINIKGDQVVDIKEKLDTADKFINGGFFVINKMALQYVNNLSEQWEMEPLSKIASDGQLMAFKHRGFWKAMDHLRDKIQLDGLANQKNPPWKTWK